MQLTGQLVLSAAALLLLTAAYRLYKSRPAQALPRGADAKAEAEAEAGGSGQPATQEAVPGAPRWDLRRRRGSKGATGPPGCSWESTEASRVPATGASSATSEAGEAGKAGRKRAGEEHAGQCPDSDLPAPQCGDQEAGTAVDGKPELPHRPHQCSEPPSPPAGLPAVESGHVSGELTPRQDSGPPKHPGSGEQESPHEGEAAHREGQCDMNNSWVFTHASGVHREGGSGPPGCLRPGPGPASAGGRLRRFLYLLVRGPGSSRGEFHTGEGGGDQAQAEGQGVRVPRGVHLSGHLQEQAGPRNSHLSRGSSP